MTHHWFQHDNTIGTTGGAGIVYPSWKSKSTVASLLVFWFSIISFLCIALLSIVCRFALFILVNVLYVLLRSSNILSVLYWANADITWRRNHIVYGFLVPFVLLNLKFSVWYFVNRCLSFFFWPLRCLYFLDLRRITAPFVSSNFPSATLLLYVFRSLNWKFLDGFHLLSRELSFTT